MSSPGLRVLIVDDEAGIRGFLRASLEAHGYSVNEASTGEEALQVVPAFRPDLILLDLGLPALVENRSRAAFGSGLRRRLSFCRFKPMSPKRSPR